MKILGPDLPYSQHSMSMVTSPDGKGVIIIGAEDGTGDGIRSNDKDRLLELRAGAISWNFLDRKMEYNRYGHTVIPLPKQATNCH